VIENSALHFVFRPGSNHLLLPHDSHVISRTKMHTTFQCPFSSSVFEEWSESKITQVSLLIVSILRVWAYVYLKIEASELLCRWILNVRKSENYCSTEQEMRLPRPSDPATRTPGLLSYSCVTKRYFVSNTGATRSKSVQLLRHQELLTPSLNPSNFY
jgi:hypothetical protein